MVKSMVLGSPHTNACWKLVRCVPVAAESHIGTTCRGFLCPRASTVFFPSGGAVRLDLAYWC